MELTLSNMSPGCHTRKLNGVRDRWDKTPTPNKNQHQQQLLQVETGCPKTRPGCFCAKDCLESVEMYTVYMVEYFHLYWWWWAVLACTVLYWAVLSCTGLNRSVLGCTGLYWAALGCTGLYWSTGLDRALIGWGGRWSGGSGGPVIQVVQVVQVV